MLFCSDVPVFTNIRQVIRISNSAVLSIFHGRQCWRQDMCDKEMVIIVTAFFFCYSVLLLSLCSPSCFLQLANFLPFISFSHFRHLLMISLLCHSLSLQNLSACFSTTYSLSSSQHLKGFVEKFHAYRKN